MPEFPLSSMEIYSVQPGVQFSLTETSGASSAELLAVLGYCSGYISCSCKGSLGMSCTCRGQLHHSVAEIKIREITCTITSYIIHSHEAISLIPIQNILCCWLGFNSLLWFFNYKLKVKHDGRNQGEWVTRWSGGLLLPQAMTDSVFFHALNPGRAEAALLPVCCSWPSWSIHVCLHMLFCI